ncbi:metalloendoproteinase 1-like [Cucumis melo var. makuwa]|uniref:Metalloendoproteinase 1-like n=2 Tax=Cucumis melo TaxID=3656 RepID=A0A5D3E491_CUCMM|nr:metalloendoproteinase 1-like [Cucumis melo]TYK30629.1 metalloendoproteinase 1-like [Cucumis melo var. makuwa]
MANKPLVILLFISIFLPLCFSTPLLHVSPFAFLNKLQGCTKGDNVKGISNLKNFFHHYGYLNHQINATSHLIDIDVDDTFDDRLESAIKTYQQYFHLNSTGSLNVETISQLAKPRCGNPDIIDETADRMLLEHNSDSRHDYHHLPHIVSHFTFFSGMRRWPSTKYHLTYAFLPGTRVDVKAPVARAFATWARYTHFKFSLAKNYRKANLKIGFYRGNHGDGYSFDGPGRTLAHSFAPTDGRFHYDSAEKWTVGAVRGRYDMQTVALHEIGHLLGLGHSKIRNSIMYPYIKSGATKGLSLDDILGIKVLYHRP